MIDVTTRSGLGSTTPHGAVTASYGTFGSSNVGFNFSYGGKNWGNFIAANGLNTGRFLDPPEFVVFHAHGNEENVFDRFDYQFSTNGRIALQLSASPAPGFRTRIPMTTSNYGVVWVRDWNPVGPTDQRSKILTFNIAPTWTHALSPNAVFNLDGLRAARRNTTIIPAATRLTTWPRSRGNRGPGPHPYQCRRLANLAYTRAFTT